MTRLSMSDLGDGYARIFGAPDRGNGRSRLCRFCGEWHKAGEVPHNCRDEAPPRNRNLASPQLAPTFGEFVTGMTEGAEIIGDRKAKREFMERHDLVEHEDIAPDPEPSERQWEAEFVADLKQVMETDPLNRPPIERLGETADPAGDIDASDIEVFK